jgi:plastocyanin
MRFYGLTLAASALVLGACAGGDKAGENAGAATDTAATAAPAGDAGAGAAGATGAAAGGAAAAITGTTHTVNMVGDEKGYRFEPAEITVKQGDGIKFVMVSGGPHNVAFDPAKIPDNVEPQLSANMPEQMSPLAGKLLVNPNEVYTMSFANVTPGTYDYYCTPHLAMNMVGKITVQ